MSKQSFPLVLNFTHRYKSEERSKFERETGFGSEALKELTLKSPATTTAIEWLRESKTRDKIPKKISKSLLVDLQIVIICIFQIFKLHLVLHSVVQKICSNLQPTHTIRIMNTENKWFTTMRYD